MNVVVDGLLTHYELRGKGKLVLILHGWGDSSKSWAGLQTALSQRYQVLAVDLPGFGASQPPTGAWKLDDYARFVAGLLQKVELRQPYAVIGHSNGGALAVRAIGLGEIRPDKLVLIAASGLRTGGGLRRGLLRVVAKTGKLATRWLPARYRQTLRQRLYSAAGSDMLVVPELQETFKRTVRQDVRTDATGLTLPVLLLFADNDRTVPLAHGQRYHQLIKHSQLVTMADSGHFVQHDQPEQLQQAIEEFLT